MCEYSFNNNVPLLSTISFKKLNRNEEIYLNRLRVDLLLKGHLYAHNFRTIQTPLCNHCNKNVTTKHFLVQCNDPGHKLKLAELHDVINDIGVLEHFINLNIPEKCMFLLFGDKFLYSHETNENLLHEVAKFIIFNCDTL